MTRKEAIVDIRDNIKPVVGGKSLDMAIEALEQEPIIDKIRAEIEQLTITEGGEDYTRKMAELYSLKIKVLQIIDKYRGESDCRECKAEHDCYECKKYKAQEQEPQTGHWKKIGYDIYECSICGQDVMTGDICAYRHCHGCGAKMKVGD